MSQLTITLYDSQRKMLLLNYLKRQHRFLFSREEVDDNDSNGAPLISASMALKSLETVRTFLTQQEELIVWRISFVKKK